MKTAKMTFLALAALMSSSAMSETINYGYRIAGAKEIAPLQVFDDGSKLYLQMSAARLVAPPVPFAADGTPVSYEIRPPYLVMPKMDRLTLRVGSMRTLIQAATDNGEMVLSSNGIRGKNVWYGAATEAMVSSYAAAPVHAPLAKKMDVTPVAVAKQPTPSGPATEVSSLAKAGGIEGRFTASAGAAPVAKEIHVDEILVSAKRPIGLKDLEALGDERVIYIEADGSTLSYRRALEMQKMMPTKHVSIKPIGAPRGYIRISKKG